jgi:hypothetical protein
MKAAKQRADAEYCLQIVNEAFEDLINNGREAVDGTFTTREQALQAICQDIPYAGSLETQGRREHIRTCLTVGWAVGMREEVSGYAKSGQSEGHYLFALIAAGSRDNSDGGDWRATTFAFEAGYYLARTDGSGLSDVRFELQDKTT